MGMRRKRVGIRLPETLIETIDETTLPQGIKRTAFIENAIREKLDNLHVKIKTEDKPQIYGVDWEL